MADARGLVAEGLVDPERLFQLFERIEPDLFRYPANDPRSFRRAVDELASAHPP